MNFLSFLKEIALQIIVGIASTVAIWLTNHCTKMETSTMILAFLMLVIILTAWVLIDIKLYHIKRLISPDYQSKFFLNEPVVNIYKELELIRAELEKNNSTLNTRIDETNSTLNTRIEETNIILTKRFSQKLDS